MKNKHIILFDGDCSFCNYWVQFITKRDKKNQFHFLSLQSLEGKNLKKEKQIPIEVDSLIFISNKGKAYIKSTAALKISSRLRFPYPLFYVFIIVPPFIRHWVYDVVAQNRHRLFKGNNSCDIHQIKDT